jgi:two-component sensor histidine kinase
MREVLGEEAFSHLQPYVEAALSGRRVQYEAQVPYKTGGTRYIHADYVPHLLDDASVAGFYALITDITQRKLAEEQRQILLQEVNHRAKNVLAVAIAIARQTAQDDQAATFAERFSARMLALGASQDLLVQSEWRGVDLVSLIRTQIAHVNDLVRTRFLIDGEPLCLLPTAAQALGMAVHELATNAVKYGALSGAGGRVLINWSINGNGPEERFTMRWSEQGGPPIQKPTRTGFGYTMIKGAVEHGIGAGVDLNYARTGLEWTVDAPAASVVAPAIDCGG